ncbi:MAG: hypothetical protein WD846_03145 [Patescibacteria group bacterium]
MEFLTGLDVNSPSWDLFIFLFFIVATFVYGFTLGRSRIMVLLVSTYMALALTQTAPFLGGTEEVTVGSSPFFVVQITAFVATMLLIFFFLSNSALRRAFAATEIQGKAWQIIIFSILHAGLLVSVVLSFVPPDRRAALLDATQNLFATETALFVWTLLPIIVMMFVRDPEEE